MVADLAAALRTHCEVELLRTFLCGGVLRLVFDSAALRQRIFAASSASSERSPFCSSTCAATASGRNLLTM